MAKKQKVEPEDEQLEEQAPDGEQESDERDEEQPASEQPTDPPAEEVHESTHLHLENLGFVQHIDAGHHQRSITYSGQNYEHVSEVDGIWSYRKM